MHINAATDHLNNANIAPQTQDNNVNEKNMITPIGRLNNLGQNDSLFSLAYFKYA